MATEKSRCASGHRRRAPESEQPADVEWMPDEPVWSRCPESQCGVRPAAEVQPDLAQAEQIEVIDQECGDQHQRPAEGKQHTQDYPSEWVFDGPYDTTQRLPLPEQQDKSETRKQDVSGSFQRLRHNAGPPILEPLARHDAVLHREERQQSGIDQEGDAEWSTRRAVESSRHAKVADETDGVEKRSQEDQVAETSVNEECDSLKHSFASCLTRQPKSTTILSHARHDEVRRTSWLWEFRPGLHIFAPQGWDISPVCSRKSQITIKPNPIDAG